jgi:muramidase (phage lysozyme)
MVPVITQNEIKELKAFGIDIRILEKLDAGQTRDLYRTISNIWATIRKAET